ncbi:Wall-associated receptor kinase-like 22 [Bienertia sinuspersici]
MGQAQTKSKKKIKINRKKRYDSKEENFMKNGAIFLEKQIALSKGQCIGARQLKIFSKEDIEKATNNYDTDHIIGRSVTSAHRTVYKASLDDRIVSIGAPSQFVSNPKLTDRYLTEASMSLVLNHDNMLKIYGCCLETSIPILVQEYVSNGSLYQHLHRNNVSNNNKHIHWDDRLKVATDVAYALSYMHNALSKYVVHRGLNSSMILVDDSFHAKFANFGIAVSITPGEPPQRRSIEGTQGYIDPEYIETQLVTDKCDVYSFGVLLLELLTRKHPLTMAKGGANLVDEFVKSMIENCMMEMIDNEVFEQSSWDEINQVMKLALLCVAKQGTQRPTMIEVVKELWLITKSKQ